MLASVILDGLLRFIGDQYKNYTFSPDRYTAQITIQQLIHALLAATPGSEVQGFNAVESLRYSYAIKSPSIANTPRVPYYSIVNFFSAFRWRSSPADFPSRSARSFHSSQSNSPGILWESSNPPSILMRVCATCWTNFTATIAMACTPKAPCQPRPQVILVVPRRERGKGGGSGTVIDHGHGESRGLMNPQD